MDKLKIIQKTPLAVPHRFVALIMLVLWIVPGGNCLAEADTSTGPATSILGAIEKEFRAMVAAVAPSVVTIRTMQNHADPDRAENKGTSSMSVGSGIFLDSAGLILTSSRVVQGGDDFWVETHDGRLFQAVLVGASADVAVLQIKGHGLPVAPFGGSADLGVGSLVAAIGNSYGYSSGFSWGTVNGFRPDGAIQLALGISPGNSGGAVVDTRGRIVGLIKAKISEPFYLDPLYFQPGSGQPPFVLPGRRLELPTSAVSLAVPIQAALRAAHRIIEAGTEPRAYVGIYVEDLTGWYVAHFKTSDGVLVTGVVARTPADRSGLLQGDIITAVDRQPVTSVRRFRQIVSQATPGQRLDFAVLRGGQPLKLIVEAGQAETPHLGATDASRRPFSVTRNAASKSSDPQVVRPASRNYASIPATSSSGDLPDGVAAGDSVGDWRAQFNAMRRTIDSLRSELLQLQSEFRQ